MEPIFEAKYLSIEWFDKNTVSKISESLISIEIEIENTTSYHMEIQAYKRIENGFDGQVAFRKLDSINDIQPYFINANGDNINLLKIIDPNTKKEWWIEDGNWSKKYQCRMSELWNHAGRTTVYFGNISCYIDIRTISFTKEQLNLYLEDFKNDFWYLILKKNSLTQVEGKNSNEKIKILNKETVSLIKKFIKYTHNILNNPKKELKEIQRIKDIKNVKPVAKTFMEIATGGMKRKLTSRDTLESFNVSENRYIHYILFQVYTILLNMNRASQYINDIYQSKSKSEQKRVDKLTNKKIIEKEVYENEINNLEKEINKSRNTLKNIEQIQNISIKQQCEQEINRPTLQDFINEAIQNQILYQNNVNKFQDFYIKLERRQENFQNKIQFWGKIKGANEQNWNGTETNDLFSLEFDLNLFGFLQENQEFKISAITNYTKRRTNNNRNMHKIYFQSISKLQPLNINQDIKNIKYQTVYIRLKKNQNFNGSSVQFWGEIKLKNSNNWYQFPQREFLSLEFDRDVFDGTLQEYTEYKVTSYIEKSVKQTNNHNRIHKRYFKYITNIEQTTQSPIEKQLKTLSTQKSSLIATNWVRELTYQEQQEKEREKQAIQKQIQLLNEESKTTNEYIKQLAPLTQSLKNILNQFDKLSITKNSYFPNSMTFVQNPNYQGAYKHYELIKNIIGIDESLFLSIQKVEKIGILDIPTLYERWCFLQIIKVVIELYDFFPEKDWKKKLILQMLGRTDEVKKNVKNISIKFENPLLERKIILHYEKELSNRKRPDYVLEIQSLRTNNIHNLILDAKFKENVNVKALIEEMYHTKNYSQNDTNTVFILHPDINKSISKKYTDKDWGHDAYYGEIQMFNYSWDNNKLPNHKYGSILLSPIRDEKKDNYGNYLDNLQRLIGMAMQYKLEDNKNIINDKNQIDPEAHEKIFCLKCGSIEFNGTRNITKSKKGIRYNLTCNNCEHNYVYNYCWNCKTRLIKNGQYWSYHASQILEPFNIKCPSCNQIFIRDNGE